MRRLLLSLAAVCLLAAPAAAAAQPLPPAPAAPAPPELRVAPYLVRAGDARVTLYVRLDRPLARRFDGELRATAVIDGRFSSLAAVGRQRAACYSATVYAGRVRDGRLFAVSLLVEGAGPPSAVSALVALRAPRPGDERGVPLRC